GGARVRGGGVGAIVRRVCGRRRGTAPRGRVIGPARAEVCMATLAASLTVPGVLEEVPHVRRWLGDLLTGSGLSTSDAADLALAVTEVCTNIVVHGYRGVAG